MDPVNRGARLDNPGWIGSDLQGVGEPPDPRQTWPKVGKQMVMEQMITVEETILASDTDFLAGSQLDQPGVAGVYTIWLASTVGDTTVTISLGGRTITNNAVVTLRANSEIRENEDPYFQMLSRGNGRPIINVTEVTAMTCRIRVRFIPAFRT